MNKEILEKIKKVDSEYLLDRLCGLFQKEIDKEAQDEITDIRSELLERLTSPKEEKLKISIKALREISEPKGRYSRDPLQFARNTIEDLIGIAKEALEKLT